MSRLKTIIFFLLVCLARQGLFAQVSIIKGEAPEYAGMEMPVYVYSDFISEEKTKVGDITFQADGHFSCPLHLQHTGICFAEFDIYRAMIHVEPGKTYEIQFPPRKKQTDTEKRNPFFRVVPVWFKIVNQQADDLNLLIKNYEIEFQRWESKYFYDIYEKHSRTSFELVESELEKKFPGTNNSFFEDYKRYRVGNLEYALTQGRSKDFLNVYFGRVAPKMNVSSYTDLFNQVFTNYFSFLGNSHQDQEIARMVGAGDIQKLEKYLSVSNGWNTEICKLIILKGLKDAYYSGQFPKKAIIGAFQSILSSDWPEKYKTISRRVLKKITYLLEGTPAPDLQLIKTNGTNISLEQFRGKLVYLHFTDLQNPVCRQHLDALKSIAEQFKTEMVVLLVTTEKATAAEQSQCPGIYTTTTADYKNAYRVKTYPSSYLIGREGQLLLSPALNPLNGIGNQIRNLLQKERVDQLRGK